MQEPMKQYELQFRLETWGENWKITVGAWADGVHSAVCESDTNYIEMEFDHSPSIADITIKIEDYFEKKWNEAHS